MLRNRTPNQNTQRDCHAERPFADLPCGCRCPYLRTHKWRCRNSKCKNHFDRAKEFQSHCPDHQKSARKRHDVCGPGQPAAVPDLPALPDVRDVHGVPDPPDATNALFATNSCIAGVLSGQYAIAAVLADFAGKPAQIATLNLFPGHIDTCANLVSDKPMTGVDSKDTTVGTDLCSGNK